MFTESPSRSQLSPSSPSTDVFSIWFSSFDPFFSTRLWSSFLACFSSIPGNTPVSRLYMTFIHPTALPPPPYLTKILKVSKTYLMKGAGVVTRFYMCCDRNGDFLK